MTVLLIADDDDDICTVLQRLFVRAGYTVVTASDGVAALQTARTQHPDVVLTDFHMPGMTGADLCRSIRDDLELADTPVAILTGGVQSGDPRLSDAAACGIMLKPFTNSDLVASVRRLADGGHHRHTSEVPCCPVTA